MRLLFTAFYFLILGFGFPSHLKSHSLTDLESTYYDSEDEQDYQEINMPVPNIETYKHKPQSFPLSDVESFYSDENDEQVHLYPLSFPLNHIDNGPRSFPLNDITESENEQSDDYESNDYDQDDYDDEEDQYQAYPVNENQDDEDENDDYNESNDYNEEPEIDNDGFRVFRAGQDSLVDSLISQLFNQLSNGISFPIISANQPDPPPVAVHVEERVNGVVVRTEVRTVQHPANIEFGLDTFIQNIFQAFANGLNQEIPPRSSEVIDRLVSENIICPNIQNILTADEQKEDESNSDESKDECLVCKTENTKEKLKCCLQAVHPECLKNWWSTQPGNVPLKCLHCQKIIRE